jgi:ferritin-like metal-binding protein YciE
MTNKVQEKTMADDSTTDVIRRYLKDAIAAENSFESQLRAFAKEGDDQQAHALFQQHAEETRSQIERLTSRLKQLGDSPSTMKSFMAHMFGMAPKTASMGHDESERVTQNLMMAYTVEHAEVAMYESLAIVAQSLGDDQTASLAREIQKEEETTARKVWALIPTAAAQSVSKLMSEMTR